MTNMEEHLKKAHIIHNQKYGDDLSEEMARRARLSHQSQIKKYGGERGYRAEMRRRRMLRETEESEEE